MAEDKNEKKVTKKDTEKKDVKKDANKKLSPDNPWSKITKLIAKARKLGYKSYLQANGYLAIVDPHKYPEVVGILQNHDTGQFHVIIKADNFVDDSQLELIKDAAKVCQEVNK